MTTINAESAMNNIIEGGFKPPNPVDSPNSKADRYSEG